jgi:hypothetical protein
MTVAQLINLCSPRLCFDAAAVFVAGLTLYYEQDEGVAQGVQRFAVLAVLGRLAPSQVQGTATIAEAVFHAGLAEMLYSRGVLWDRLKGKAHLFPGWQRAAVRVVVTFFMAVTALRGILHPGVKGPQAQDALVYMGALAWTALREIVIQKDNGGLGFACLILASNSLTFGLLEAVAMPQHFYSQLGSGFIFRAVLDIGGLEAMRHNYQPQFFTALSAHLLFNISRTLKP